MAKALALELLESLYNELMRKAKEGVYSGEVLEHNACDVLANIHASRDPFCIYRQELTSKGDRRKKSNDPLSHVIRRLNEEIFAITTTKSYPILLTPKLYTICVSLLCELSFGKLPPLFLETYDGHVDKFESDFKPLMLEMFVRRAPWWILAQNIKYLVKCASSGISGAMRNDKIKLEFEELSPLMSIDTNSIGIVDFLPLMFTSFESLKKGISDGGYLFSPKSNRDKHRAKHKRSSNLVGLGAIIEKTKIVETFRSFKKSEKTVSSENPDRILDTFALTRISIAALLKILANFRTESARKGSVQLSSSFKCMINDFKISVAALLAGTELLDSGNRDCDAAPLDASNKGGPQIISQQIFELDGSTSNDIFTLENKVNTYFPFHFLHIQVVSGMRNLVKSLNYLKGSNLEQEDNSGFIDFIIAYVMRMLNQLKMIVESKDLGSIIHDKGSSCSVSKFNRYSELIPSELILLMEEISVYYAPCRSIFKKKLLDLHVSQLKGDPQRISSFFIVSFTQALREGSFDDLDTGLLRDSWHLIFKEIVYPGLLDPYKVDLFISMISSHSVVDSLSLIDMESFIGKYFGVISRILAYHPDLAARYITLFIMNCITNLKSQQPNFKWLNSWTKMIISIICTPLMTFFPQRVNCSVGDLKAVIGPIKPNNRILHFLSVLAYPKIYGENSKKSRPDLMSIISDLPTNLLLISIYNSSYSGNKRLHTLAVFSACNRLLDLLVNDLISSLENYKRNTQDNSAPLDGPMDQAEQKNITKFTCDILKVFPYLFHQGAKYSQEIYEKVVKILLFILTKFDDLLFQDEVFESILNSLKFEFHSNIITISPICWAIGEAFLSKIENNSSEKHDEKILRLIESLKLLLEGCYSKCIEVYNEWNNISWNLETDYESNSGVIDDANSECSNSSYSSFISDSSIEIDHVSEDGLDDSFDHFIYTGGEPLNGDAAVHTGQFTMVEHANENFCKNVNDGFEDELKVENKYLDNIYLIETIVSTLCKIGLSCKQYKSNVSELINTCSRMFQFESFDVDNPHNKNILCQDDQLIHYSRFILYKKISICTKSLSQSSMFSLALHRSQELPSSMRDNRSIGSILL
ncbi:hypothetical protein OJ252_2225 [Cryptosporidium canis]|uniref:Uncharacterized protein n=1 Tax=Cryptosporidium canis TaxID=195482 RepID=A0ABQ8P856_9CRYT|nr:hypothetical protein OJ252_2225 [Cryptosporidium canis]